MKKDTSELTEDQENIVYKNRSALIDKANGNEFFIEFGTLKLPAKVAGIKLKFPIAYSGNYKTEITWALLERIATGEVKIIL